MVGAANIVSGRGRRIPLSVYLVGLLLVFVLTAAGSSFFVRAEAQQEARQAAIEKAQFAADLVASEITAAMTQLEATVTRTAANPTIASVFISGQPCNVALGSADVFQKTDLDFIAPNGDLICSSAGPVVGRVSYSGAAWLQDALRGAVLAAPVASPRTGRPSVVSASPAGDRGVVAGFADLSELGATLAPRFAARRLELLITTADGGTVLTRSVDAGRWAGTPIASRSFANAGGSTRPDLDNIPRVYGEATVGGRGWKVYAGAELSVVVSTADRLFLLQLLTTSVGLLAALVGTLFVYRRVVGPIRALSRTVSGVTDPALAQPASVTGPSEIAQLAQDFNELIITLMAQLADRRRAEADARAMLDASLDAVVGIDEEGKIVEWSRQAETTFGWRRAEAVGRPFVSLILPERYQARDIAGLEEYRRTGVGPLLGRRIELEACARDGLEIPVEMSINLAETPTGHVFTAFIRDLSTRRTSEQQRLGLEERLRQSERLEGIGRLAGGIAHDFNNILAVVMNYSQFVEDSLPEDSELRDDVVQIRLASERGATFTRQLLTFAHRGAVNPQNVQLNTVLEGLRTMLRRTIPQSVKIDLRLAPDLSTIRIDVGQLEQLLLNLIVNAADAMPHGGTVLIETANSEHDEETPTEPGAMTGPRVRLEVTDTGHGMSKDVIARAFEPFFTTKPKGKGTGLGLATAYGIVHQALGAISIQSVVGRGTTVRVDLPAQIGVQPESATLRAASVPDAAPSEATVFVVEDEPAVRKAVVRILSDRGYSVLQAPGPKSAVELATLWTGSVDLLLTNIVMTDMSGDELARELRKARPHLRVVYLTGYSDELQTAALGIDGPVVHKPFTRDSLLAAVEGTLAENV